VLQAARLAAASRKITVSGRPEHRAALEVFAGLDVVADSTGKPLKTPSMVLPHLRRTPRQEEDSLFGYGHDEQALCCPRAPHIPQRSLAQGNGTRGWVTQWRQETAALLRMRSWETSPRPPPGASPPPSSRRSTLSSYALVGARGSVSPGRTTPVARLDALI
jgi:hypothetical protein